VDARLPAHFEIAGLIRRVQAEGGFAAVIKKGERDAGTILVVMTENGENSRVYERMPQLDGNRVWTCTSRQDPENKNDFLGYLERRGKQDVDFAAVRNNSPFAHA